MRFKYDGFPICRNLSTKQRWNSKQKAIIYIDSLYIYVFTVFSFLYKSDLGWIYRICSYQCARDFFVSSQLPLSCHIGLYICNILYSFYQKIEIRSQNFTSNCLYSRWFRLLQSNAFIHLFGFYSYFLVNAHVLYVSEVVFHLTRRRFVFIYFCVSFSKLQYTKSSISTKKGLRIFVGSVTSLLLKRMLLKTFKYCYWEHWTFTIFQCHKKSI